MKWRLVAQALSAELFTNFLTKFSDKAWALYIGTSQRERQIPVQLGEIPYFLGLCLLFVGLHSRNEYPVLLDDLTQKGWRSPMSN